MITRTRCVSRPARRWFVTLAGVALATWLGGTWASAAVFDFRVDRFAVDGNVFGPLDGVPDRVDDFSDGVLPPWFVVYGTASEHDGFLHLTSPGTHVPDGFGAVPGLPLDLSEVYYSYVLSDGRGSFTATAAWDSTVLGYGDFNHFSLFGYVDPTNPLGAYEVVGVAISNPTPAGQPAAYSATRFGVRYIGGAFQPLDLESVSIDPATITGQIVLRIAFDDATNAVTVSLSVDGGATFLPPFTPVSFFTGTSTAVFLLGSDPLADPPPPPPLCAGGTGLRGTRVVFNRLHHTLIARGKLALPPSVATGYDPAQDGAQLRIEDSASPAIVLVDLTGARAVPAGSPGSGCGPRDGWVRRGATFTYHNQSNALPPACAAGSARGLQLLRVSTRRAAAGEVSIRARFRDTAAPDLLAPLHVTAVLGDEGAGAAGRCASAPALGCVRTGPIRIGCSD